MENKGIVVGIGELLWDVFPDHKQMGGAPCNFAFHVSKLGLESLAISAIGKDDLGDELIQKLDEVELNYDIQKVDYPTGTVQVTLSGDGIPQYEICEPVAWDFIEMKEPYKEMAKNTSAVCFGSLAQRGEISRAFIRTFVSHVPDSSLKVFDINLRQQFYTKALIHESLSICNVLKINDDEIKVVAELFDLTGTDQENCQALLNMYKLKLVALTCGTDGSYLINKDEISFKGTPKVKVADTVGAGDSFTSALVVGILNGDALGKTHKMAVELSAFVCTQKGAMPEYSSTEIL